MRTVCWLSVVTVLACAATKSAEACSAVYQGVRVRGSFPLADARDVPTSVRPIVSYDGPLPAGDLGLALRGPDGAVVEADRGGNERGLQLIPKAPLAPFTRYEIVDRLVVPCGSLDPQPCSLGEVRAFSSFTTGAGPDTEAPTFQGTGSIEAMTPDVCAADTCCGRRRNVHVRVAWPAAQDAGGPHILYELRLVEGKRFGSQTGPFFVAGPSQTIAVNCEGYQDPWHPTIQPEPAVLAIRAFDLSGNVTANPSDVRVDVDCAAFLAGAGGARGGAGDAGMDGPSTDSGCSCTLGTRAGGPAGAFAILLAFALTSLRRRRHM